MPTYEYLCEKCSYSFEKFQSMRDNPIKKCPKCNSNSVKRLIGTGGGIIFKGAGFYQTDYKKSVDTGKKNDKNTTDVKPCKSGDSSGSNT